MSSESLYSKEACERMASIPPDNERAMKVFEKFKDYPDFMAAGRMAIIRDTSGDYYALHCQLEGTGESVLASWVFDGSWRREK